MVARLVRVEKVAGSNPVTPINAKRRKPKGLRRFALGPASGVVRDIACDADRCEPLPLGLFLSILLAIQQRTGNACRSLRDVDLEDPWSTDGILDPSCLRVSTLARRGSSKTLFSPASADGSISTTESINAGIAATRRLVTPADMVDARPFTIGFKAKASVAFDLAAAG